MDPALLREREAFKKRAMALPVIGSSKKTSKGSEPGPSAKHRSSKKRAKSKFQRPKARPIEGVDQIKEAAKVAQRSNNPYRILKTVVDMMRQRYKSEMYESLKFEEILSEIDLTDLRTETREWLFEALKDNVRIYHSVDAEKNDVFLFKPVLGLEVKSRLDLLRKLKEFDREGLGGVKMSDITEALAHPEKALKKLDEKGLIFRLVRFDKEEIVFYNNNEFDIKVDEEFRALWRSVGVDHLSEADIEKHLLHVGLAAMQGEARKRKAPSHQKTKRSKKQRPQKILNTHLPEDVLKDYTSSQGTGRPIPT